MLNTRSSMNQTKTSSLNLHLQTDQIVTDYLGLEIYDYIQIIKKKTKK